MLASVAEAFPFPHAPSVVHSPMAARTQEAAQSTNGSDAIGCVNRNSHAAAITTAKLTAAITGPDARGLITASPSMRLHRINAVSRAGCAIDARGVLLLLI